MRDINDMITEAIATGKALGQEHAIELIKESICGWFMKTGECTHGGCAQLFDVVRAIRITE